MWLDEVRAANENRCNSDTQAVGDQGAANEKYSSADFAVKELLH